MAIKILLDTDPGSDIDDAVCIGYLLSNPDCELLGITTVTGEGEVRAEIASAVCHAYAREDVPIYPGTELPLLIASHQSKAPHGKVLPRWPHSVNFPRNKAIDFLRAEIHRNPHEIELVAIGALTNLALLFALDPEVPALLRGLTVMGGHFPTDGSAPMAEHNMRCDPHAAAMVFASTDISRVTVVGIDVTFQVTQTLDEIRACFSVPQFAPILNMAQEWFAVADRLCYHDIIAASTVFRDDLCTYRTGEISVVTEGPAMGQTPFTESPAGRHQVAATVNRSAFLDHFCAITGCRRTGE